MDARGDARTPGKVVSCDITRKADGWFLSLVIECEPHRECGSLEAGLDWGVETFATIASAPGLRPEGVTALRTRGCLTLRPRR